MEQLGSFLRRKLEARAVLLFKSTGWMAGCLDLGKDCKDPEDSDIKGHGRWPPRNKVLTVTVNRE